MTAIFQVVWKCVGLIPQEFFFFNSTLVHFEFFFPRGTYQLCSGWLKTYGLFHWETRPYMISVSRVV